MDNIFEIPDAEKLRCVIQQYQATHSALTIHIYDNEKLRYRLGFGPVAYFSGPMNWKSANFRLGTQAEFDYALNAVGLSLTDLDSLNVEFKHKVYIVEAKVGGENEKDTKVMIFAYQSAIERV